MPIVAEITVITNPTFRPYRYPVAMLMAMYPHAIGSETKT